MNQRMAAFLGLTAVALAGCASEEPAPPREEARPFESFGRSIDAAVPAVVERSKRLADAARAYRRESGRWPPDRAGLEAFVRERRLAMDPRDYASITLAPEADGSLRMEYVAARAEPGLEVERATVTVRGE